MRDDARQTDVLIVGAGMAGLTAASALAGSGLRVLVADKSRGVGGRMASRRIGEAALDHGAQFITSRTPRFTAAMEKWESAGVVAPWFETPGGHRCRRGCPAMTAIAKHLARDLDIRLDTRLTAVIPGRSGWRAATETGGFLEAATVILTPPVPQSLELLRAGGTHLPGDLDAELSAIVYDRCLAVLAIPAGMTRLQPPGALRPEGGPIAWLADNCLKGVSPVPAVTIHATPEFSEEHWDDDADAVGRALFEAARPLLGTPAAEIRVHRWRYSRPRATVSQPCVRVPGVPPLLLAGDAFGGPRVEGAALSGWAAADALEAALRGDPGDRVSASEGL